MKTSDNLPAKVAAARLVRFPFPYAAPLGASRWYLLSILNTRWTIRIP